MTENDVTNGPAANGSESNKTEETHKGAAWEWVKSLLSALVIALLIREFVVQAFTIPTGSMESTMLVGDHLFVNKLSYGFKLPFTTKKAVEWGKVNRGNIIVFLPPQETDKVYVKRCMGLPGDTLELRAKELYINGVKQEEPYKKHLDNNIIPEDSYQRDNLKPFTVPKPGDVIEAKEADGIFLNGKKIENKFMAPLYKLLIPGGGSSVTLKQEYFFMMGDNRDNSNDSRFWGFVPRERLIGRPVLVWMPLDRFGLPPR